MACERKSAPEPETLLVAVEYSTDDDDDDLQILSISNLRLQVGTTTCRRLSSASIPEEFLRSMSMRSAMNGMYQVPRFVSTGRVIVRIRMRKMTVTIDDYAPSPQRKSPKVQRKSQTSSGSTGTHPRNVNDLMAQFKIEGFTPMEMGSTSPGRRFADIHAGPALIPVPTFQRMGVSHWHHP